jgi:leucyl aminopeptidase
MTDFSQLLLADTGQTATTIHLIDAAGFDAWLRGQPEQVRTLAAAQRFAGKAGQSLIVIAAKGAWHVVAGTEDATSPGLWSLAKLVESVPAGTYRLGGEISPGAAQLGWLLSQHHFTRYKPAKDDAAGPRILLTRDVAAMPEWIVQAEATALVRDLVDTPAADMGPAELAAEAQKLAAAHGGELRITKDADLESGYPMIHAVGRAATRARAPRLIEVEWGNPKHPRIAIVGKGVCFDSGGLDIKPAAGMLLMKKDMGGAAHALGLAHLIMAQRLPVRLHLLIAAVENAISAEAFRPGDVLTSRKGLTVEIGNTDAEGRLVLADAITRAQEDAPELMIDFATLTGAARVALGPDLPALFTNDDGLAADLLSAGDAAADPMWRMPLWAGYDDYLKSDIADMDNSGSSGFAGAITAALFLNRFVDAALPWAHFDTFAWNAAAKPGRPKGGAALGLRAAWAMLKGRYGRA